MEELLDQIWDELIAQLRAEARSMGVELGEAVDDVAAYASARTHHLSSILASGEPGFAEAVTVERDNVALKAGLVAAGRADDLDARIQDSISGALQFAANALVILM